MLFLEVEGPELKAENAENAGGGVDVEMGPWALLSWVKDERRAGPGTPIGMRKFGCDS